MRRKVKPMTDREALRLREQRVIELEELLSHARMESANLRNEIKLLDSTNAKLRLDLAVCRSELASKIGPTIFASENRPEDRSGLGAKYGFVEKYFKPFPTIVPYPDPVVIEAHGLRIKVEKL